jgi:hypothetical protein
VPAHQIPPRHFEEIQDIKKLLQQCSACKQHNERKQNTTFVRVWMKLWYAYQLKCFTFDHVSSK